MCLPTARQPSTSAIGSRLLLDCLALTARGPQALQDAMRELRGAGVVKVNHMPGEANPADLFTKVPWETGV